MRLNPVPPLRRYFADLSRDQWIILIAWFTWGLGTGLWFNLQTLYVEQLGATPQQVGAVIGLSGLVATFLYIPAGLAADRWRRKPIIVAGWVIGTLATLAVALPTDWRWAAPGFAVYWLSSFSRPAVAGHIAATNQSGNVSRVFAILSTGAAVGEIISPGIGGWIADRYGLRIVFLCAVAVYVVSTLAVLKLSNLPPSPRRRAGASRSLVLTRPFLWQVCVVTLIVFALDLGYILAPNYLQAVKGLSLQQIGQLGSAAALGRLLLMFLFGQMHPARRTGLILSQGVAILGLLLLLRAPPAAGAAGLSFLLFYAAFFARGTDRAVQPIIRGRFSLWLEPSVYSLGFSFLDTATRVALTLSPILAGQLYGLGASLPLLAGIVALAASGLFTLTLPAIQPARPAQPVEQPRPEPARPQA